MVENWDEREVARAQGIYERRRRVGSGLKSWEELNPDDPQDAKLRLAALMDARCQIVDEDMASHRYGPNASCIHCTGKCHGGCGLADRAGY